MFNTVFIQWGVDEFWMISPDMVGVECIRFFFGKIMSAKSGRVRVRLD